MTRQQRDKMIAGIREYALFMVPCAHCGARAGDPCVSTGVRSPSGTVVEAHKPRRESAFPAYRAALAELGDQVCPDCGQRVGDLPGGAPPDEAGWHRCRRSSQMEWIRGELARLRAEVARISKIADVE